ncbi:unnamed protein product [Cylindrotheca closterium]|uniref:Uncharacterized protein n=1 Tax=Cylindrotheca closterium TaxID=2856 RepID=A0AAD2FDT6_9STRA|nr:unnamed protein product [Cylindrotheca closterium]
MTKLFQRFQFPRKQQQKQHQQVRKSLGSSSSVSSSYSTSIRMKSVRPASIYLQNQSSGRTGVNKYTCSPRLSLYLQEMQDGPQQLLWNQERAAGHESRPSSSLLAGAQSRRRQLHDSSSRSLMEDLHTRTNQTRLADSGTRQQAPYEKDDASFSSLSTVGLCEERSNKEGEDAAAGPSSSSSSLRLRFEMSDYLNDNEFSMSMF